MRSIEEIAKDIDSLNNSIPTKKETDFVPTFLGWQKRNAEEYAKLFVELTRSKEHWINNRKSK